MARLFEAPLPVLVARVDFLIPAGGAQGQALSLPQSDRGAGGAKLHLAPPVRSRAARAGAQRHHPGHARLRRPGRVLLAPRAAARARGKSRARRTRSSPPAAATWSGSARRSSPSTGSGAARRRGPRSPWWPGPATPRSASCGGWRRTSGRWATGPRTSPRRSATPTGWEVLYRHVWAHRVDPAAPFARALRDPGALRPRQPGERAARGQGALRPPLRVRRGRGAGRAGRPRPGGARRRGPPALDPAAHARARPPAARGPRPLGGEAELGLRRQERPPGRGAGRRTRGPGPSRRPRATSAAAASWPRSASSPPAGPPPGSRRRA